MRTDISYFFDAIDIKICALIEKHCCICSDNNVENFVFSVILQQIYINLLLYQNLI